MLIPVHQMVEAPPTYRERQAAIAAKSTGPDGVPCAIEYQPEEHETWARMQAQLAPLWEQFAAPPLIGARRALDLPTTHIPQLSLVSQRLAPLTGFRYASVPGTVSGHDFFGALANRVFSSTQFIRLSLIHI